MRRWPVIVVTWALGTSTGVLLGLFGVQLVATGITDSLVSPLSRPEVLRALQAEAALPPASQPPADLHPSPLPDPGAVPPLTTPVSPPARTPPASSPPRPGAVAGTTTTVPPTTAPPPTTSPPTTAPPAPPPAPKPASPTGVTRTITSAGGTVAVRYESGRVSLLWARPNDGFDVEVGSEGPEEVEVEFRSRGHRSRVRAFYADGAPAQEVVEHGREGGGGKDG